MLFIDSMLSVTILAAFTAPVSAFWRLPCKAPLVTQRADPLMSPGQPADHLHTIMGGNGFGFEMTYNDTQASTCSSCYVTKDFSNYWAPTLFYQSQNGSFIDVGKNGGALIYYLQRSDPLDPEFSSGLLAFPAGFRMTAGNQFLRNYSDTVEQQAISFACLGTQTAETHNLPNYNCPGGLRAQVFFPSCWDGVNLDSPDHKSHMSYPSIYNAGHCPASHPKRFISIFYEITWNVDSFKDMWYGDSQPFVLSTGDPTGYSYHGDFINGWDVPTLQRAVNECTSADGVIEECSVFDFFPEDVSTGCKIPPQIDEQTSGILSALPGCNPIQAGPENATQHHNCNNVTTTVGAPMYDFPDLTKSAHFSYLGCGYDFADQPRTLSGPQLTADNITNAYCVSWCAAQNYTLAGTEYSTQCYCGNEIVDKALPSSGLMGACDMPCSGGDGKEMCGGNARLSLWKQCGKGEACENVGFGRRTATAGTGAGAGGNETIATAKRNQRFPRRGLDAGRLPVAL